MPRQNIDPNPTQEQIARRAYQIFEERGRPEGCDREHWLEAERQLRGDAPSRPERRPEPQPASPAPKAPRRIQSRQPAGV